MRTHFGYLSRVSLIGKYSQRSINKTNIPLEKKKERKLIGKKPSELFQRI